MPSQVPPGCPPELDAVMRKVLQKSPAERCQSMEDLLLELDPICKSLQSATVAKLVEEGRDLVKQGNFSQTYTGGGTLVAVADPPFPKDEA